MAKQVAQFRYYDENSPKNSEGISMAQLTTNNIFDGYLQVSQLGIQSLPGTEFYLNESTYPIIIGNTGIYELNVDGIADITNIKFELKSIRAIQASQTAYLIIDIIYDDGM